MERRNAKTRNQFNRRLMELRINAGMSPNDLGRRALVSGNTVRSAERGRYIDPRSQYAIATALGVATLDVFPIERQRTAA